MAVMALVGWAAMSCQHEKTEVRTVEKTVHDTVFVRDTVFTGDTVTVHDTVVVKDVRYYEGRWMKELFETCEWKEYKSYEYGFTVSYPEFMEKDLNRTSESCVFVSYKDIQLIAKGYRDNMSLEQKYRDLSRTATTKSLGEDYFMMAGKTSGEGRFFEKDVKMGDYWIYIRVEFPQPFAPYIDTLLQYVKNYGTTM